MADITQIKVGSTTYDIKDAKANIAYGTCTTAAATAAKVVTITNNASWSLTAGSMVTVLFSNTNTASNPTLNVNSTGAKNIYYGTAQITTSNLSYAGYASRLMTFMYDGTQYRFICWGVDNNSNTVPSVQMETAAGTAAKVGTCTNHTLLTNSYVHVNIRYTNTYAGAITLNIDSAGAKPIYINGAASSSSNYSLKAGTYIAFYDGTNFYFRDDGKLTANITGSAGSVAKALTFNNGGAGAANGTTFDGSTARTISYNTIGAAASSHTHTKSQITDFPSTMPPSSHSHGNITNGGALGTASRIVVTDSSKNITTGSIDPANLVVTTDSRLSDARTPTSHTHTKSQITDFPTIPTVNNATITIAAGNGLTTGGDFTTNQSSAETITLNVGQGTGITVNADNIAVKYGTEAGTACQGNDSRLANSRTPTAHASANTTYGAASASNYGHAKASSTTPKAAGTAAVGNETDTFARGDHVHPAQTTVSGNAGSATKLATARTIALGTGATGTATSFNGSANITIPVTDVKESYLSWGGKSITGGVSPMGAALSSEHSANRLAFLNANALTFEQSDNGGSSWSTVNWGEAEKVNHVTTSANLLIGASSAVTTNSRARMTLTAQDGSHDYVYTRPKKLLINMSTNGHGVNCKLEYKTGASGASWQTLGTYTLDGWSGWNEIDVSALTTLGGGAAQTSNNWYWRLTYAVTSVDSSRTAHKPYIIGIRLFGDTCWTRTSNLGDTGHIYSYDYRQNVAFPAGIKATYFDGPVATTTDNGLMSKEDKAKLDSMGNNPGYTYGTNDLVAGTSPLASGLVYFVYE